MTTDKQKEKSRKRQQAFRNRRNALGLKKVSSVISNNEAQKLNEICEFFALPDKPLSENEAISSMINRFHSMIPALRVTAGKCSKCKTDLPNGCDGLFKGDGDCWHTLNRIQLHQISEPGTTIKLTDFIRTIEPNLPDQ
ncbi:hypothetical protein [Photobacterium sp.]|uniref:hypothetical protein n=1 Tax=Photobacterium sp. TaxID=660 RepID=UPI00299E273F|nr:hypothetical protein [Photobacterium sp.]MDX1304550.1 hypothetical protein [Photobacterium sp.]